MKVSLVISTYNWKDALRLCLESVKRQTIKPLEVIIADDGSNQETRELIEQMQKDFPCSLKHVWHEDKGWRKCIIMNKAFAMCEGEYVIGIDGDIIMHRCFIEDHIADAQPGYFLIGSRGKMSKTLSQRLLKNGYFPLSPFTLGVYRKFNVVHLPWLTPLFYTYKQNKKERGCNMSFWRKDLLAVNGYDERFLGYGFEDIDLAARLRRLGIKKRFLKFKAIEYHIYHKAASTKKDMSTNEKIFKENNRSQIVFCELGISQYI